MLLEDLLEYRTAINFSPRTIKRMRENLPVFIKWLQGSYRISTPDLIRPDHLYAWQKHLMTRRTWNGLPIKPGTINGRIAQAKVFLEFLAERGFVLKTLADSLKRIKEPKLLPHSVLDHTQMRMLLSHVDTSTKSGFRDRTIFELLYSCALRASEVLDLDIGSISFEQKTLRVLGKGRKERLVPVGRTAIRFFKSYILAIRPFLLKQPDEHALFLDKFGRRYAYHNLQRTIRVFTRKLGFDFPVTAHTFRRSCATELIRAGANIYHVKELLGHESLNTLKHYARLTIIDLKKTHEKCHPREIDEPPDTP